MSAGALWGLSLGVGAVVVGVVALLLHLIVRTAGRIRATLEEVWVAGPAIANNTAHLDLLRRINRVSGEILDGAGRIAADLGRIQEHADGCAGCPYCVVGWEAGGARTR